MMQAAEQLPWELEEKILSLLPVKIQARFRSVCKRWNSVFNERRFFNNDLGPARPQFILLSESKFCSVNVNLDGPCPSIEVHDLPSDIPGYELYMPVTVKYCDGLLIYATCYGIGICNPWLRQIQWIQSKERYHCFSGMGYDNSRPDKHYKIFTSNSDRNTTNKASIIELGSHAEKNYEFASDKWKLEDTLCSVSLNGTLYWVAYNLESQEHFIQSFDFSTESFKPYCILPSKNADKRDNISLAVFRIDRFSFLEKNYITRNIEIWVTKEKIKNGDGEAVEWTKFMNVSVPEWSSLGVGFWYPPSYFIDEDKSQSPSLVLCCYNKEGKACIYIAKGDKFNEIEIKELFEHYCPRHRAYCPSLVQVPTFTITKQAEFRFALPRGVEVSNGVGGKEWDDSFFDHVKKINFGWGDLGLVYIKCDYRKGDAVVVGAVHGNATHIPYNNIVIAEDDYIEAVEGTYNESHITFIAFRTHKRMNTSSYGLFDGRSFALGGGGDSKIIGFYGALISTSLLSASISHPPSRFFISKMCEMRASRISFRINTSKSNRHAV